MHHGAKEIARIREESIPVGTFFAKGTPSRQVKNQF